MLRLYKTTNRWIKYWQTREIDWQQAYGTSKEAVNHPHREALINILSGFNFNSILEIGCGAGVNLLRIRHHWPTTEVGGVDVSQGAIDQAKKNLPTGMFECRSAEELYFTRNCTDGAISDACLIYMNPKKAKLALKELARCSKYFVVLCEFNSTSWLSRLALRLSSGYYAHNYRKMLDSLGYYDIQIIKFPKTLWPGLPWERYGHFIIARCPQGV